MEDTPKHVKRALRELAGAAHEEGLRRALVPLQAGFDRWARGELSSGELTDNRGFRNHELTDISQLVVEHRQFFLETWHEYFGRTS